MKSHTITEIITAGMMAAVLMTVSGGAAEPAKTGIASGPFLPTDESLKQYKCPDWFRDAKLGIWAVWGPESVPEDGDWYARNLYQQGGGQNKYHLEHYGHPSKFGFKDVIPLWKAEKWEPEKLMELYKKAGAKYFCMIAEHHDNFDCWNSKHQRWNSVNMGPKRDIAGEWQQAARKNGLRFGMTEHLAASWWFYSAAKGSDTNGPMAGVAYDGADPKYADLYWSGNEKPNGHYYLPNAPDFVQQTWFNRIQDMIDRYHPDLLYSDSPLPYPDNYGRKLLAHYYNDNQQQHQGRVEAIYNCKQDAQGRWVQDLERGVMGEIHPEPWQTDTCVGDWYYQRSVLEQHRYKSPATVIHMLCDIVSKNGNLLLNFPPKPDGTLDDDELKILDAMASWIAVNGEAIYGTRPWLVYGEGGRKIKGGGFNEGHLKYTARDIRFTTKGDSLYAIALGWPENGKLVVRSLAAAAGKVTAVSLVGHDGKLEWSQTAEGLVVSLPATKPCDLAWALKIAGQDLKPVPVPAEVTLIQPAADGKITLPAREAEIHGSSPVYEEGAGKDQIGHWADPNDSVSWNLNVTQPGKFKVTVTYSCNPGSEGSVFNVEAGDQKLEAKSEPTTSWATYRTDAIGVIELSKPGQCTLAVKPKAEPKWKVIGLKSVVLVPVQPVTAGAALTPQKMQNPVVLNPSTINCLPAMDAMRSPEVHEGAADSQLKAKRYWLEGIGEGMKIAWNVSVAQAGDYRPTFVLKCDKAAEITVSGPNNRFVFHPPDSGWQRSAAQDFLKLGAGTSTITVQVTKGSIGFKGIDLVNVAEEPGINQRIAAFKGDTTWMKEAGYGIMVQGGGWAYPPKGDKKPWPGFAEDFDARKFVDTVEEMGGKYLVWSATWDDYLISAPIQSIAEVLPQRVSKRDLIGELIAECKKHNIRFMMYYHLGHNNKDVLLAKGWKDAAEQDFAARSAWLDREAKIFAEIGQRYGSGLDAIFLDDACVWYPADFEKLGAALKAGNPKRVVCYNPWILPCLTPFQDFWCGENFTGERTPYSIEDGLVSKGPQQGLQLFGNFMFDGPDWGIHSPNIVIENSRWTADKIVTMVRRLEKERYSVAINLLMYEDGSMNPVNVGILKEAARQLKRGSQKQ